MTTKRDALVKLALACSGRSRGRTHRAWALTWRVVRFLEAVAEHARTTRLESFDPRDPRKTSNSVYRVAAACVRAVVPSPPFGNAATVAALMDATDMARAAAKQLYTALCLCHPKASAETLHDPRRLAKLRAARTPMEARAAAFLDAPTEGDTA